ncbi:pyruvate dehydrogenase phosphatase regulatory subunit, mitochondrial-like [Stylophora pistillata]|uniref:pyruvate dehydrogenase phosphatase regulatory subunit, mitochondrial-like n=1 Tax=Stylophora pistillata TaxID=50429 RepID=UPI000C049118|nr:pyruvate dehydrogenase phosphatase regulatory subunit, mitochondrial-like [Stylophora pistillata]
MVPILTYHLFYLRTLNVDCEMLSTKEIQNLFPLEMKLDDVLGGLWIPSEGVATSSDVCQSLAKGATLNGVKIFEKVAIESIITDGKSITGVKTSNGTVKCEILVNCAGQWAWELGQVRDPKISESGYYLGLSLSRSTYQFYTFSGELLGNMLHRFPFMEKAEIRQMINGPESFTPDGRYLLGEVPEVSNFYVAAGFNSSGIAGAGGAGMALAGWITEGEPIMDLSGVDIRRFAPHHNNKRFLRECVKETLSWHYLLRYPYSERKAARGLRCSPLFPELNAAGATWSEKMGWEVPKWFALPGEDHPIENGFGKPGWLGCTEVEYKSCTDGVAVVDLTALGLFEIESRTDGEVEHFLQYLCANDVAIPVGCSARTLILNKRGGIELNCTVIREAQNRSNDKCVVDHDLNGISRFGVLDTAGEERYSGLSSFYCRGASAAILAYDISQSRSLRALRERYLQLLDASEPNCLVVVVGTKKDLVTGSFREIASCAGESLALELNEKKGRASGSFNEKPFFETSAKSGENVQKVFDFILNTCLPLDNEDTAKSSNNDEKDTSNGTRACEEAEKRTNWKNNNDLHYYYLTTCETVVICKPPRLPDNLETNAEEESETSETSETSSEGENEKRPAISLKREVKNEKEGLQWLDEIKFYFGDQKNDWKLLVPVEFAVSLYREMMEAGRDLGVRNAGQSVLDGLRIERLIPQMGKEMTSFVTPREAGVMDRVQLNKKCNFLGKQALLADDQQPAKKHLVQIALQEHDDDNYPWGGEPILRNGSMIGSTTSTCHSFKLDLPVCLGYLEGEELDAIVDDGRFEIDVAGTSYPVSVHNINKDLEDDLWRPPSSC